MSNDRHVTWQTLSHILEGAQSIRIPIKGQPQLDLLIQAGGSSIGLLLPWSDDNPIPASPLAEIQLTKYQVDQEHLLLLSTSRKHLYHEFQAFIETVADKVQLEGQTPIQAIEEQLISWHALLREAALLSKDAQVGLLGELWTVIRLSGVFGPAILDGWVGPHRETHDIRIRDLDLEVKTTTQRDRVHVISDLKQLVPSPAHDLYLVSLQLQPAGHDEGVTLSSAVAILRTILAADHARKSSFEAYLQDLGYSEAHARLYNTRFQFRTRPSLVPVDGEFPVLSPTIITDAMGPHRAQRIERVQYWVNVEGLGFDDGSTEFLSILPKNPAMDLL